jgi:hypothetical protein
MVDNAAYEQVEIAKQKVRAGRLEKRRLAMRVLMPTPLTAMTIFRAAPTDQPRAIR